VLASNNLKNLDLKNTPTATTSLSLYTPGLSGPARKVHCLDSMNTLTLYVEIGGIAAILEERAFLTWYARFRPLGGIRSRATWRDQNPMDFSASNCDRTKILRKIPASTVVAVLLKSNDFNATAVCSCRGSFFSLFDLEKKWYANGRSDRWAALFQFPLIKNYISSLLSSKRRTGSLPRTFWARFEKWDFPKSELTEWSWRWWPKCKWIDIKSMNIEIVIDRIIAEESDRFRITQILKIWHFKPTVKG